MFIASQVKYFIDHLKVTGHYKRSITNNCNKITKHNIVPKQNKINLAGIEQVGMPNAHIYSEAGRFYDCLSLADEYILYSDALTQ